MTNIRAEMVRFDVMNHLEIPVLRHLVTGLLGNHKFDFCWVLLTCKASQLGSCSQALRKGKERKKYVTRVLKIDVLLALTEFSEGGESVVLLSDNSFNFMQETFVPSLFEKYFFSVKPSSLASQRRPLLNVSTNVSFTMQTKGR